MAKSEMDLDQMRKLEQEQITLMSRILMSTLPIQWTGGHLEN